MNETLSQVKKCFESALKRDQSLAGTIHLTLEIQAIDGGGRVTSGEVPDSELHSPFFEACVLEAMAGADFPEPPNGETVRISYPVHFDPGGGWGGQ